MARTKEQQKAYNAKYYAENAPREKQRALTWYENNYKGNPNYSAHRKQYMKLYYAANKQAWNRRSPEKRDAYNAKRRNEYKTNPEMRERLKRESRDWAKQNPQKARAQNLRTYGLTPEQFNQLLESQGGKCAICGHSEYKPKMFPFVDHCHTKGRVRGLLCGNCNFGIGKFKDSPELLRRAATYLEAAGG